MMKQNAMKISFIAMGLLAMLTVFLLGATQNAYADTIGNTYYVDAINGEDTNEGTSEETPWKTLEKVNAFVFSPGDKILFKTGCVWDNQQLKPQGSGNSEYPIIIDQYGENGDKPLINTNGAYLYGVHFFNLQYWEVNNIKVTNTGTTPLKGRTGIVIEVKDLGIANHIYLKNVDVENVNGNSYKKDQDNGGIYFRVSGNSVRTKFNDILIEGCTVKNVNRSGIFFGYSTWDYLYNGQNGNYPQQTIDDCSHTNIIIRNNYVESAGGDAIVVCFSDAPLIEYNVCNDCCETSAQTDQASAGMWSWRCEDAVFQYNEAYGSHFGRDGQAWDVDYGNRTVYQYNYSHDNGGGAIMFCMAEAKDGIYRYNISQNDGFFLDPAASPNGHVYNNTFYAGPGKNIPVIRRPSGKLLVENNIFYNLGTNKAPNWDDSRITYDNNLYYGYTSYPSDSNKVIADPVFVDAGTGGIGINSVQGYQLMDTSPAINAGKSIANNGGKDYWGNPLYKGAADIGAFEAPFAQATTKVYTIDDRHAGIRVTSNYGVWSSNEHGYHNNTITYTDGVNDYIEFSFRGTKIEWLGTKGPELGMAKVFIDGELLDTVDCYNDTGLNPQVLFSADVSPEQHTIRIQQHEDKNPNASGYRVVVDAFRYVGDIEQVEPFSKSDEEVYPELATEFKKLYHPDTTGAYINDHTVVEHNDGTWHLIGITSHSNGGAQYEDALAHGVGNQLIEEDGYVEKPVVEEDGKGSWAPHIVKHGDTYFMYYATDAEGIVTTNPGEENASPTMLYMATSTDLYTWNNETQSIKMDRPGRFNRDPMILKVDDKWLMYATWIEAETGRSVVSLYETSDLYNWTFEGYALTVGGNAPHVSWGSTESPFVFYRDGYYYLSVTLTDSGHSTYENTAIFRSSNPRNFGYYDGSKEQAEDCEYVTSLPLHAPEYIESDGEWYVTTCGWKNLSSHEVAKRGAAIAKLQWSIPTQTIKVDDRASQVSYSTGCGDWSSGDYGYYEDTISFTNDTGAYCEFIFTGTSIQWLGITNIDLGIAEVYIDGELQTTVDCYSASGESGKILFNKDGLSSGEHTIKIVQTDQKNESATNYRVVIDGFIYGE